MISPCRARMSVPAVRKIVFTGRREGNQGGRGGKARWPATHVQSTFVQFSRHGPTCSGHDGFDEEANSIVPVASRMNVGLAPAVDDQQAVLVADRALMS